MRFRWLIWTFELGVPRLYRRPQISTSADRRPLLRRRFSFSGSNRTSLRRSRVCLRTRFRESSADPVFPVVFLVSIVNPQAILFFEYRLDGEGVLSACSMVAVQKSARERWQSTDGQVQLTRAGCAYQLLWSGRLQR